MASERGDIQVNMTGNQTAFQATLNKARQEVKAFAKEASEEISSSWSPKALIAGGIGFLGFEAFKSAFEGWTERVKSIKDLSEELDQSANEMERLRVAGKSAGLEFQKVANILTIVQQKRLEAENDPKTRSLFERLGVSRRQILDKNMGIGEFVQAMGVGRNDDATKDILMQLVGPKNFRGLRGLAQYYPSAKGEVTEADMHMAEQIHEDNVKLHEALENLAGKMGSDFYRAATGGGTPVENWAKENIGPHLPAWMKRTREGRHILPEIGGGAGGKTGEGGPEGESIGSQFYLSDEELDAHAAKMRALAEQNRQAERALMPIEERRQSVMEEILKTQDELSALDEKHVDNAKDALEIEERRWTLQNKILQLRRDLQHPFTQWETRAALMQSDLHGGTTFGVQANPVVRAINDLHFTVRSQGIH